VYTMRKYNDDEMLSKLQNEVNGDKMPRYEEINNNKNLPHANTYIHHFGSLKTVAKYLGLQYSSRRSAKTKLRYIDGKAIRNMRLSARFTQKELSYILDVSASAISLWEREKNNPCYRNFLKLKFFFKCNNEDLIKDCFSFYDFKKYCLKVG